MLPLLEAFRAQEINNAGIPSVLGDIGRFQHEGDMTLPLLEGCLLVLGGPVECGRLEYELSGHCAGNRLKYNGLERNPHMSGFQCNLPHNGSEWRWS